MQSQPMFLPPRDPHVYSDSTKEPQYVTTKRPTNAWLYFNSQDAAPGTDRTNCVLGNGGVIANGFSRIRFIGVSTLWDIPNVNVRNNTFQFYSSNTGATVHTCSIAEKFYDLSESADLMDAIVAAMNTLTGATGLTFSKAAIPFYPRTYTLSAVGGTFYFSSACTAITKGEQLYGIPRSPVLAASKQIGPMQMIYTQYVDIVSRTLTKFQKAPSVSTKNISPIVIRAYIGGNRWGISFYQPELYLAFAWQSGTPLYNVDFEFFDQHGDPLYTTDNGQSLKWQITMEVEY